MSSNESNNEDHSTLNNNDSTSTPEEINVFVTHLLEQMKNRFVGMGSSIISRMEDLDSRMKDLEKTVEGLMEASGTTRLSSTETAASAAVAAPPAAETTSRSSTQPNSVA